MRRSRLCSIVAALLFTVLTLVLPLSAATTNLTLWAWANQEVIEQFEAIVGWYQEINPGVEIEIAHIAGSQMDYLERFLLASAGGAASDVAWIEGGQVKHLAALGLLQDVTRSLSGLEFTPGETSEVSFGGRLFAAPYHCTSRALFKRVETLEQVGLNPYQENISLDELRDWNRILTVINPDGRYARAGLLPWVGNWGARGWIWAFGGELVKEIDDGLFATADELNNIAAFEWLDEWAQIYNRTRSPVTSSRGGFISGTMGMYIGSTSDAAVVIRDGTDFVTGPVPHPAHLPGASWGGGYTVGIPTNTPARAYAEGMHLLQFFASTDVQTRRFREFESLLPANWKSLRTIAPSLDAPYAGLLAQLPVSRPRTPLSGEYNAQLTDRMNDVIAGKMTPRAALEAVQVVMSARFAEVFGGK